MSERRLGLGLLLLLVVGCNSTRTVRIGTKADTETGILGEIAARLAVESGLRPEVKRDLATQVLFKGMMAGDLDVYAEYTGTLRQELLLNEKLADDDALRKWLGERGVVMSRPLGFNNTYALGMRRETAAKLGIKTVSDLRDHPGLTLGFTPDFVQRRDGWAGLKQKYRLPQANPSELDHAVAYRALSEGSIQVADLYATDAEIVQYDLVTLADDTHYFPAYEAVWLYRAGLADRCPDLPAALARVEGKISDERMTAMNVQARAGRVPEAQVAADFLAAQLGLETASRQRTWATDAREVFDRSVEHLTLVGVSLALAIAIAIPLGVVSARTEWLGRAVLVLVGIVQTIPSLALLVFVMAALSLFKQFSGWHNLSTIGTTPALIALFCYSLLPIVRNTFTGLRDLPVTLRESAEALGLPPFARLRLIELPLAARSIMGGIKTAAVINVGTATLGGFIGAGGYGQLIIAGLKQDDLSLILMGAVPAAALAMLAEGGFDLIELLVVPRGLRLKPAQD